MLFNSIEFIIFFAVVFTLYWFVFNKNLKYQNLLLLICSYIFYGWWDWRFLSLIIFSSGVDYYLGLKMYEAKDERRSRQLLYCSLIVNLGLLGFFKYFNFFADSLHYGLTQLGITSDIQLLNIILPVGISFYTFQSLSYTIDVYRKELVPTTSALNFFTFVAFFPQLVAGPIERAKHLLPQFSVPRTFDYDKARNGAQLVLMGFFKKVVIADSLAGLVNTVYNNPENYTGFPMVVATIFFAFQIYCDFSGYSDIARGTARILGFDLMINFRTPYFSKSLGEFWRRWHISLSTWFRDYVYIPLGGNRLGVSRTSLNIFATFVLSGLWHGANWTFVIWGAIHGVVLVLEKTFPVKKSATQNPVKQFFAMTYTFSIVCFAWVFFRSNTVSDAFFILTHMFSDLAHYASFLELSLKFRGMGITASEMMTNVMLLVVLLIMEAGILIPGWKKFVNESFVLRRSFYLFLIFAIIISATKNTANNFIYFQF